MSKGKKHQRECPALGRTITSAECGSGRGSIHACPAECPHFPFTPANYDQHGEIEQRLIQKTYERAARMMTDAERERLLRVLDHTEGTSNEVLVNHARFVRMYHGERDAEGRTFSERWLADKTGGLGLHEMISTPPPLGHADEEEEDDELDEDAAAALADLASLAGTPGPHALMAPLTEREVDARLSGGPQPVVMQDRAGTLYTGCEKLPRKDRPPDEARVVILAFLKSLVAEFSRALA